MRAVVFANSRKPELHEEYQCQLVHIVKLEAAMST